jgi:hypothetical protein
MKASRPRTAMRLVLAASAALLIAVPADAAPIAGAAPTIEPARRPDADVVVYREVLGEIGGGDRGPTLTICVDRLRVPRFAAYPCECSE